MRDRHLPLNLTKLAAAVLGITGLAIVVVDMVWLAADDVGHLGLAFIAGGAVLRVRSYFCDLDHRLRNAFEYGRTHERVEGVRSIR